jgi:hypothetical protein
MQDEELTTMQMIHLIIYSTLLLRRRAKIAHHFGASISIKL